MRETENRQKKLVIWKINKTNKYLISQEKSEENYWNWIKTRDPTEPNSYDYKPIRKKYY